MTEEDILKTFGKLVHDSERYEVHVIEKDDGLHVYSFRKNENRTELPRGFILGDNSMWHRRYWP